MEPLRSWWDWCSESFGQMFVGVTAPILLIAGVAVLIFASGGGSLPRPPRSDVAGVCINTTPGAGEVAACATPAATSALHGLVIDTATPVLPTPTPAPRAYTVRPGDTLLLICATAAPGLPAATCVDDIVALNDLGGPDEIVAGQTLQLPATASATAAATRSRTPTPVPARETLVEAGPSPAVETDPDLEPTQPADPDSDAEPAPALEGNPDSEPTPADENDLEPTPDADDDQVAEPTPGASLVPLLGDLTLSPDATIPPDFDMSQARLYVVEPGESILSICFDQYPDMAPPECVQLIVVLNDLSGPDEVFAHQGILLP